MNLPRLVYLIPLIGLVGGGLLLPAVVALGIWRGSPFGDRRWADALSAAGGLTMLFSATLLVSVVVRDRVVLPRLMVLSAALSIVGWLIGLLSAFAPLWDFEAWPVLFGMVGPGVGGRIVTSAVIAAVTPAVVGLVGLTRFADGSLRLLRSLTLWLIAAAGATLILGQLWRPGSFRLFEPILIAGTVTTLMAGILSPALGVLHFVMQGDTTAAALGRPVASGGKAGAAPAPASRPEGTGDPSAPPPTAMTLTCPRCRLRQTLPTGKSRCRRCRLRFAIDFDAVGSVR